MVIVLNPPAMSHCRRNSVDYYEIVDSFINSIL